MITIPSTLTAEFNCVIRVFTGGQAQFSGNITATGTILEAGKMATLFKDSDTHNTSNTYVIGGDLT